MKTYLKIKIKSLAAEALIIKKEEARYRKDHPLRASLRNHRLFMVRTECRAALLAYGFLRGRKFKAIESKSHERAPFLRAAELVRKYAHPFGCMGDQKECLARLHAWGKAEEFQVPKQGIIAKIASLAQRKSAALT